MRKYSDNDIFRLIANNYTVIELPFDFILVRKYSKNFKRFSIYHLHRWEKTFDKKFKKPLDK
jgi:hypothetical protein